MNHSAKTTHIRTPNRRAFELLLTTLLLTACGTLPRQATLGHQGAAVSLLDFADVRAMQGYPSPAFQASYTAGLQQRVKHWQQHPEATPTYEALVLGAGGANGAFGAGILKGWTASKQRPAFDIVTGVSVGALIASFAFVGSSMDDELEKIFRRLNPEDIYKERGAVSALFDESLMDARPIRGVIHEHITPKLIDAVAGAHAEGRRLYVGTTNFDLGQLVVWDMGAIASRRSEAALMLFRKVLLASASIPVFFPPVLFDVTDASGTKGQEMHVDGSIATPMFLPQQVFDSWQASRDAGVQALGETKTVVTVIHNGSLTPQVTSVARDTVAIAVRTLLMASSSMAQEDILHLYVLSRMWGSEFQFACLPEERELSVLEFSEKDTDALFLLGYERGRHQVWSSSPPDHLVPREMRNIQPALLKAPDPPQ